MRSIGALAAGFLFVVILSLGTDVALHAIGVFPPWGQPVGSAPLLLATIYRTIFGLAGSYITARLAPNRPMQHALAGGVIGVALSTIGAVVTWNRGAEFGPHWYPVALIVLAMPQSWVGGKLRELQLRTRDDHGPSRAEGFHG
jgi:hypothetical protein